MEIDMTNPNTSTSRINFRIIIIMLIINIFSFTLFGIMPFLNGQSERLVAMEKEVKTLETLKMQVRILQAQMDYVAFKYRGDNQIINRIRRAVNNSDSASLIKPPIREHSDPLENKNRDFNVTLSTSYNNQMRSLIPNESGELERNNSDILDADVQVSLMKAKNNSVADLLFNKMNFKSKNYTTTINDAGNNDILLSRTQRNNRNGEKCNNKIKGEKRRQKQKRHKCNNEQLHPLVATFIGLFPYYPKNSVYIGPWVKYNNTNVRYDFTNYYMADESMSIEVSIGGLYMISAQMYYVGRSMSSSYWLKLKSEGAPVLRNLVKCAITVMDREGSCHTNIITYLQRGDRLYVQQEEKDRYIDMREGFSYLQFMLIQKNNYREPRGY